MPGLRRLKRGRRGVRVCGGPPGSSSRSRRRHGFGQLTRFLDAEALAACQSVTAAPLAPVLPAVGSLATTVDAALGALWDG